MVNPIEFASLSDDEIDGMDEKTTNPKRIITMPDDHICCQVIMSEAESQANDFAEFNFPNWTIHALRKDSDGKYIHVGSFGYPMLTFCENFGHLFCIHHIKQGNIIIAAPMDVFKNNQAPEFT